MHLFSQLILFLKGFTIGQTFIISRRNIEFLTLRQLNGCRQQNGTKYNLKLMEIKVVQQNLPNLLKSYALLTVRYQLLGEFIPQWNQILQHFLNPTFQLPQNCHMRSRYPSPIQLTFQQYLLRVVVVLHRMKSVWVFLSMTWIWRLTLLSWIFCFPVTEFKWYEISYLIS